MAVAADEQHRQSLGAVGWVMVHTASEDHEPGEGSNTGKAAGALAQLGRIDVRSPSARAQGGLRHLLLECDAAPPKPLSFKAVQAFCQRLLRDAVVDVNERVRRVSPGAHLHRLSIISGAGIEHGSGAEETRPVECGRRLLKPLTERFRTLLQGGHEAHGNSPRSRGASLRGDVAARGRGTVHVTVPRSHDVGRGPCTSGPDAGEAGPASRRRRSRPR